ncbi:adenosylhomocysteine nucleosidase [Entamoeba marina]
MVVIGVISSTKEELNTLIGLFDALVVETIFGMDVIRIQIKDNTVVFLQCGSGKVNASIAVGILHNIYHTTTIIYFGYSTTLHQSSVNQVVVAKELVYLDVDLTSCGHPFGELPNQPIWYLPDKDLISVAVSCGEPLSLVSTGTSDSLMKNSSIESAETKLGKELVCYDMESCSIVQSCNEFHIRSVVFFKVLNKTMGNDKNNEKEQNEQTPTLSSVVFDFIKKIVD